MKKIKTIDLFAGIGGIRIAFEQAGFNTVFANDFDEKCSYTYNLNFPKPQLSVCDIKKIKMNDIPNFDLLLGGFPCQPFSVAGNMKGVDDERGTLFFEILKILKEKKPLGFFLENVKNLKGKRFESTFNKIIFDLDMAGYDVKHEIFNTMEHGNLPQNRERVYIIGFRKETKLINKFKFPKPLLLTKRIEDLLEQHVDDTYYYNSKPLFEKIKDYPFKTGVVYQWRRKYIRENKSGVSPTLTANMGTGGHNVPIIYDKIGIRKLTPKECALLQGFPESYKFPNIPDSYLYKQIGNSVSIPVVARIAKNMMLAIN